MRAVMIEIHSSCNPLIQALKASQFTALLRGNNLFSNELIEIAAEIN
jgi:hypothetical protein